MRVTRKQIEAMAEQCRQLAIRHGVEGAESWRVDHASCYGGYCISYAVVTDHGTGEDSLGGAAMDANRIPAGDFYRSLRILRDVLERL